MSESVKAELAHRLGAAPVRGVRLFRLRTDGTRQYATVVRVDNPWLWIRSDECCYHKDQESLLDGLLIQWGGRSRDGWQVLSLAEVAVPQP